MEGVKLTRLAASAAMVVVGVLLAPYGLFALTFKEGDGPTYVTMGGHRLDAHLVGGLSLIIGVAALVAAIVFLRRRRVRDKASFG